MSKKEEKQICAKNEKDCETVGVMGTGFCRICKKEWCVVCRKENRMPIAIPDSPTYDSHDYFTCIDCDPRKNEIRICGNNKEDCVGFNGGYYGVCCECETEWCKICRQKNRMPIAELLPPKYDTLEWFKCLDCDNREIKDSNKRKRCEEEEKERLRQKEERKVHKCIWRSRLETLQSFIKDVPLRETPVWCANPECSDVTFLHSTSGIANDDWSCCDECGTEDFCEDCFKKHIC